MTGRERTERLTVASSETVSLAMTGQAERSWTASMAMTGQFVSSEVDAAASGGSAADTATSEADSWTGEASEADSWIEEASWAQYAAHTLKMVTTITGRAAEGGRTSKMAGLESADVTGMPAACTDISGESITQAIRLRSLGTIGIWVTPPPPKKKLLTAMTWRDSGMVAILAGNSAMAAIFP